ncbi:hypothetical protein TELCIR_23844, partial [Teladorsagia circumcincta]
MITLHYAKIMLESRTTKNLEIAHIYTDWVNRYLAKAPNYKPIDDISNELRDYRLVAKLIQVV